MSSIRILIGPYIKSEQFRNTFIMFACPTKLNMLTNIINQTIEGILKFFEFLDLISKELLYGCLSSNQLNNATQDLEF